MNHFFSILLYNIAFLAIAFVIWVLLSVSFLLFKRLTFNKWALKKRDVPLKYNQVRTRRFAAVDFNSCFGWADEAEDLFSDGIHPNARGAKLLAERAYSDLNV